MGFKYSYDISRATREIYSAASDCNNKYNDGFIAWGAKQDLYRLKFILDEALKKCPSFGHTEEQWLKEQEQKKIIQLLKTETKNETHS